MSDAIFALFATVRGPVPKQSHLNHANPFIRNAVVHTQCAQLPPDVTRLLRPKLSPARPVTFSRPRSSVRQRAFDRRRPWAAPSVEKPARSPRPSALPTSKRLRNEPEEWLAFAGPRGRCRIRLYRQEDRKLTFTSRSMQCLQHMEGDNDCETDSNEMKASIRAAEDTLRRGLAEVECPLRLRSCERNGTVLIVRRPTRTGEQTRRRPLSFRSFFF